MKPISVIQQDLWFGFLSYQLSYHTLTKFLAGGGEYSRAHALQVVISALLALPLAFDRLARRQEVIAS